MISHDAKKVIFILYVISTLAKLTKGCKKSEKRTGGYLEHKVNAYIIRYYDFAMYK